MQVTDTPHCILDTGLVPLDGDDKIQDGGRAAIQRTVVNFLNRKGHVNLAAPPLAAASACVSGISRLH